jgi:hypothetical protein
VESHQAGQGRIGLVARGNLAGGVTAAVAHRDRTPESKSPATTLGHMLELLVAGTRIVRKRRCAFATHNCPSWPLSAVDSYARLSNGQSRTVGASLCRRLAGKSSLAVLRGSREGLLEILPRPDHVLQHHRRKLWTFPLLDKPKNLFVLQDCSRPRRFR